ncbi:MAG: aldo/keto reductase [Sphingomonas hengshuiensis]|uniref:Aldo/keto reductase n=1 Tax=Sphingomonas hengshuiensis TaxID=1609977 RepID=A0A2W5B320_9SPHN|nr:MAG: aldo/keto reductase [Sphingomonas hengshuiensis]
MNLSHAYGVPPSEEEGARLLNRALDFGVTLLDTAALYGGGRNEALLGKAVMHRRAEFTLASKCVLDMRDGQRVLDGRPEAIAATLDAALARLKTDCIDLYYLHRLDRNVPIEDSIGALVRAKESGKIRALGLSEMSAATIARAHAVHPIAAVQNEYSPIVRNPEGGVLAACRARGIALVAYSPLVRGLLAGAVRDEGFVPGDIRLGMPRFREPNLTHNLTAVDAFNRLARDQGATPAQLSLAWLLAQGNDIVPIPGTTRLAHLADNLAGATLRLGPEVLARIDETFGPGAIRGPRYAASAQAQIDTEILPSEETAEP